MQSEPSSVWRWLHEFARPDPVQRILLEELSLGEVPATDWLTDEERDVLRRGRRAIKSGAA